MKLLENTKSELSHFFKKNNIKFKSHWRFKQIFKKVYKKTILGNARKTVYRTGLTQVLALNYGSKNEIIRAIKKLNEQNLEVTEENLESCLDTSGMGDVDILIRTSGEVRLSNYLLWQNAYAEMFFTQTYWPDFNESELDDILSDFGKRERRFGGIQFYFWTLYWFIFKCFNNKTSKNESIFTKDRSKCPSCNHLILVSQYSSFFLFIFKGKCSYCGAKISFQYFLVELLSAIITLTLFIKLGLNQEFIFMCLLSYVLIMLSFIDLKYKVVPDYLLLIVLYSLFATNFSIIDSFRNAFYFQELSFY